MPRSASGSSGELVLLLRYLSARSRSRSAFGKLGVAPGRRVRKRRNRAYLRQKCPHDRMVGSWVHKLLSIARAAASGVGGLPPVLAGERIRGANRRRPRGPGCTTPRGLLHHSAWSSAPLHGRRARESRAAATAGSCSDQMPLWRLAGARCSWILPWAFSRDSYPRTLGPTAFSERKRRRTSQTLVRTPERVTVGPAMSDVVRQSSRPRRQDAEVFGREVSCSSCSVPSLASARRSARMEPKPAISAMPLRSLVPISVASWPSRSRARSTRAARN